MWVCGCAGVQVGVWVRVCGCGDVGVWVRVCGCVGRRRPVSAVHTAPPAVTVAALLLSNPGHSGLSLAAPRLQPCPCPMQRDARPGTQSQARIGIGKPFVGDVPEETEAQVLAQGHPVGQRLGWNPQSFVVGTARLPAAPSRKLDDRHSGF